MKTTKISQILLFAFIILWFLMYAFCMETTDWFIENILVFIAIPLLILTYKKFQFSNFGYICIFLFLVLHIWGHNTNTPNIL